MKHPASYRHFSTINGRHPLRDAVPDGYIDYAARRRHGGQIFYFNFPLAREMGLLAASHPDQMNATLQRALLDTFSLQIINEYDVEQGLDIPGEDRLPGQYMATRYLQLQHPGKRGATSGDGRGLWNGYFKGPRGIWDISSCGTGTTALSPAVAHEGRYIRTGDDNVSYGNGRAYVEDGVCAAMMSEIFHHSDIATERTLAIIAYPDGSAINVRVAPNLLRPAHFFMHVKQNNLQALEGLMDYYIDRQVQNGEWPRLRKRAERYQYFLDAITEDFARMAARFESDYIFCWLDWDGDNILMNGGIIDYGSLRQFGLFHHEYRYDDVERMSTTITEQKNKARYIVQTFAQIVDALLKGKKSNIKRYARHRSLQLFDKLFSQTKDEAFLYRMGLDPTLLESVSGSGRLSKPLRILRKSYDYFERAKSSKGVYPVSDGISWDAIFSLRDCLREMPDVLLKGEGPLAPASFIEMIRSRYASNEDLVITRYRKHCINRFQQDYRQLITVIADISGMTLEDILYMMKERSAIINRSDRITGDAIIHVAEQLIAASHSASQHQVLQMFNDFVDAQILSPEYRATGREYSPKYMRKQHNTGRRGTRRLYRQMIQTVVDHSEGL